MERLSDQYRVNAGICKRELFGPSRKDPGLRRQPSSHRLERLECDDIESKPQQTPGQLARAGSQVEHAFGHDRAGMPEELPPDSSVRPRS